MVSRHSYKEVVQPSLQAVVSIYTSAKVKKEGKSGKFSFGPFIFDMPDDNPGGAGAPEKTRQALGSGVIVRKDGLVITNHHVIKQADEIKVVLNDGRFFDAEVIVSDPDTDLAALRFIKTDKNKEFFKGGFPEMSLGRGDTCEVGDVVIAIGNNLGLQGTVTQGIISAVGRFMDKKRSLSKISVPLIQTSASINPGSSGGALVNMKGELVGINTAIVTPSGGNVGLAFAVPSNYISPVLAAVDFNTKKIQRPYIGCSLGKLSYPSKGVLIHSVKPGGPADAAGVKAKDVVMELDGHSVHDSDRFLMRISLKKIGESVRLKVQRGKKSKLVSVVIGEWQQTENKILVVKDRNPLQGATLAEMNPDLNTQFKREALATGILLTKIEPNSPAATLFRTGDQIMRIGNHKIDTLENVTTALDKLFPKKAETPSVVNIRVLRAGVVIEFRLSVGPRSKL